MRVLRFEISRAFKNIWFISSAAAGTVIGIADCVLFLKIHVNSNEEWSLSQIWLGTDYQFAFNSIFFALLPLIACLPYASTCYSDIKSGYERTVCVKTSRINYVIAKAVAVSLSGAAAVAIPLLIDLFVAAGLYPDRKPNKLTFLYAGIIDCNLFPRLFALHPVCYCLVFTLLDAVFGGLMCLVAMGVAGCCRDCFSTIMGPFALYISTGVLLTGNGIGTWSVMSMLNPLQEVIVFKYQIVIVYVVTLFVSLLLVYMSYKRREVL